MISKFEVGKGYWATNATNGKRSVVVALGVVDGVPTFAKIREFGDVEHMMRLDGREFAKIAFSDGIWTASSNVFADVFEAKRVIDAVVRVEG